MIEIHPVPSSPVEDLKFLGIEEAAIPSSDIPVKPRRPDLQEQTIHFQAKKAETDIEFLRDSPMVKAFKELGEHRRDAILVISFLGIMALLPR